MSERKEVGGGLLMGLFMGSVIGGFLVLNWNLGRINSQLETIAQKIERKATTP